MYCIKYNSISGILFGRLELAIAMTKFKGVPGLIGSKAIHVPTFHKILHNDYSVPLHCPLQTGSRLDQSAHPDVLVDIDLDRSEAKLEDSIDHDVVQRTTETEGDEHGKPGSIMKRKRRKRRPWTRPKTKKETQVI